MNKSARIKQTIITILKWLFSILITFFALIILAVSSFNSFLILLLAASLLFPPLTQFWRSILPFLKNRLGKITVVIILFILGLGVGYSEDRASIADKQELAVGDNEKLVNVEKEENPNEEKLSEIELIENEITVAEIETVPVIEHEILYETVIRYDKAPSYFVLIDEVDLSNDRFKEGIKNLIDKIVTEKGAKVSIEILDDRDALQLMYNSHYGVNTLGRILNKSERTQLEKHSIASFNGELETDIYFNTLSYFTSATKSSPKVGQYVGFTEYNPVIKDNRIVKKQRAELKKQKAENDQKKKDFEENCFSSWDGSHRELVKLIKANMNDKNSFEHEATTYTTLDDYAVVVMKFRGKNAFGTMVLNSVKAKVNYDCTVLEIME